MSAFQFLKKRWSVPGCLFSILFSLACIIGGSVYRTNSINGIFTSPLSLCRAVLGLILIWAVTMICFTLLSEGLRSYGPGAAMETEKSYPVYFRPLLFVLLMAEYLLVLAAYHPGVFSYDITLQTDQALGLVPYNKFHPPLHTLIWSLCLKLSGLISSEASLQTVIEGGMTVYAVFQSILLAVLLSGIPFRLFRPDTKRGRAGTVLLILFFLCNPLIWIFAVIPTKDALFAIFFTGVIYRLIMIFRDPKSKRDIILLTVDLILSMLLRNNAVYAFLLAAACMLFLINKTDIRSKKRLPILFAATILISFLIQGPVYNLLGVDGGDPREALSLPYQQMAHVYVSEREQLSAEDLAAISAYLDTEKIPAAFNPRFADPVKNLADKDELSETGSSAFLPTCFRLFCHYPDNYINEFLTLNVSAWYPLAIGPDAVAGRDYIETFIARYEPAQPERDSYLPGVMDFLDGIASFQSLKGIPVLNLLCSASTPVWILLLILFLMTDRGQKTGRIVLLPSLFLWATYLAGPVTCTRYIYPLMLALPLQIFVLLHPPASETDK
ncbi:MAG: hypothetical protein IJ589_01170 [Lachnospiraceae bacterium]|nr:hypothetical protein [Lachnospiraceae bacterium]